MAATDFQSLLNAPNVACYSSLTPGEQSAIELALLQQIVLALSPAAVTDYKTLLAGPNIACYSSQPQGIQRVLKLALLQIIAQEV
jgi:hypothetical protein